MATLRYYGNNYEGAWGTGWIEQGINWNEASTGDQTSGTVRGNGTTDTSNPKWLYIFRLTNTAGRPFSCLVTDPDGADFNWQALQNGTQNLPDTNGYAGDYWVSYSDVHWAQNNPPTSTNLPYNPNPQPTPSTPVWEEKVLAIVKLYNLNFSTGYHYLAHTYQTKALYKDGSFYSYTNHPRWCDLASPPSHAGYSESYNTNSSGTGNSIPTNTNYISTRNYYAVYAPINYQITCQNNNGSNDTIINYNIKSLDKFLGSPTKTGFDFIEWEVTTTSATSNWRTDRGYAGGYQVSGMYGNVTLKARYYERVYYIDFKAPNATDGYMERQGPINYTDTVQLKNNAYTRVYTNQYNYNYLSPTRQTQPEVSTQVFTFDTLTDEGEYAWSYNGTLYTNKQQITKLTSTDGAVLEFQKRWGSPTKEITLPTRTGYTFGGWYSDAACTSTSVAPFTAGTPYTPDGTNHFVANNYIYNVYAKWIRTIGIFNLKRGDEDGTTDTTITWTAKPIYEIYELGWFATKDWYTYNESHSTITDIGETLPKKVGHTFNGFIDPSNSNKIIIDKNGNINTEDFNIDNAIYVSINTPKDLIPDWKKNILTLKFKIPLGQIEWVKAEDEDYYFDNITGVLMYRETGQPVTYKFTYDTKKIFHPQIMVTASKKISIVEGHQFFGTNSKPSAPKHWEYNTEYFNEETEYCATDFTTNIKNNATIITLTLALEESQYGVEYCTHGYEFNNGNTPTECADIVINTIIDDTAYNYSQNITLATPTVESGFSFIGWVLASNLNKTYKAGNTVNKLTTTNNDTVTFFPLFIRNKVILEFVDNKNPNIHTGDSGPDSITIATNEPIPQSISCPSRPGFDFAGYYIHTNSPEENPLNLKPTDEYGYWGNIWTLLYNYSGTTSYNTWDTSLPSIDSNVTKYYAIAKWVKKSLPIRIKPTFLEINPLNKDSLAEGATNAIFNTLYPYYTCTEASINRNGTIKTPTITQITTQLTIDEDTVNIPDFKINYGRVDDQITLTFANKTTITNSDKSYFKGIRTLIMKLQNLLSEETQEISFGTFLLVLLVVMIWVILLVATYPLSIRSNFLSKTYLLPEEIIRQENGESFFYVPIPCQLNYILINTEDGWQKAIPYIYTGNSSGWEVCRTFISNGSKFNLCGGDF